MHTAQALVSVIKFGHSVIILYSGVNKKNKHYGRNEVMAHMSCWAMQL